MPGKMIPGLNNSKRRPINPSINNIYATSGITDDIQQFFRKAHLQYLYRSAPGMQM